MRFKEGQPNISLMCGRLESEEGHWNLGFRPVMFGFRLSLYKTGNQWYTLDYCTANNSGFAIVLLLVVERILERYPEDVTERQLQDDFPRFHVKPIDRDPACWQQLQAMAGLIDLATIPQFVCPKCGRTTYNPEYVGRQFCRYDSCHATIAELEQMMGMMGVNNAR